MCSPRVRPMAPIIVAEFEATSRSSMRVFHTLSVGKMPQFGAPGTVGAPFQMSSLRGAIIAANANAGADTITLPAGTYTLTTQNMPILATLKGWKYGFNSPFKAEERRAQFAQREIAISPMPLRLVSPLSGFVPARYS